MGTPEMRALLSSEIRMAKVLKAVGFDPAVPSRVLGEDFVVQPRTSPKLSAEYYQQLHDHDAGYQENNWLVSEHENFIASARGGTLAEIGCGNGKFTKLAASNVDRVFAFDWARSPGLFDLPENVAFVQGDIRQQTVPDVDMLCSADVLEHFTPKDLAPLISKFSAAAIKQYHVIACYDDSHSHLTIMPPGAWLALFWRYCPDAKLHRIDCRRNRSDQLICVITNIE